MLFRSKFSTYAMWWIKQAISQHILKRKRMIRLPAHAAGIQRKLMQAAAEFKEATGMEPSQEELLEMVDASETVLKATMSSSHNVVSLSQTISSDPASGTLEEKLEDDNYRNNPFYNVSSMELLDIVKNVLTSLTDKESAILRLRFGLFEGLSDETDYRATPEELEKLASGSDLY